MRCIGILLLTTSSVLAQQQVEPERIAAAVPILIEQRNAALDGLALCQGDLRVAQKKLSEAEEKLAKKEKNE